jgi:hypothetical protein
MKGKHTSLVHHNININCKQSPQLLRNQTSLSSIIKESSLSGIYIGDFFAKTHTTLTIAGPVLAIEIVAHT